MNDHPYRPTVRSQADLETVWRHLMRPLGFAEGSIWMMHLEPDGRAVPSLMEIADAELDAAGPEDFATLLAELESADPGGSYCFLRSRPGRGGVLPEDRDRATFLYAAGRAAGVRLEVVHLATDTDVVPLPLDEVGLPRSA
ncbi:hypothetical protein [Nocardioides sp.]|uniref:hypothetical protein n=1 Tax=Nocardioides sp. TaxID=35761 RepID=UPI00261967B3|nr:hypothetical protein [Nocardioides sp.]MDI6910056.1 hypothetical protein [Nocardioides sp.]